MTKKQDISGTAALKYIKHQLSGGGILSDCINELPLANGTIYALAPEEASEISLYNFENGGIYPIDEQLLEEKPGSLPIQNDARTVVVEMIQQFMKSKDVNCCLFEDPLSLTTDPIADDFAVDFVHLNSGQIFYFFNSQNNTASTIIKALKTSEAHTFLCVLSSLDITLQNEFSPNKEISLGLLEKFAAGIYSFFVMAYDHEGYLMWVKK